jgi:hypothetical protein
MIPDQSHGEKMLLRVKGEFLEMPGLRVTEAQARRLWGLDADSCGALLHELVRAKFLFRTRDGAFMRVEHARPLKTSVRPDSPDSVVLIPGA